MYIVKNMVNIGFSIRDNYCIQQTINVGTVWKYYCTITMLKGYSIDIRWLDRKDNCFRNGEIAS